MDTTIDDYFAMLEAANEDQAQSEIIFVQLREKIAEHILVDETMFYSYSARYHRAMANFFRSLGNVQDEVKQETLATRFQSKYEERKPLTPPPPEPSPEREETEEGANVNFCLHKLLEILSEQETNVETHNMMRKLQEVTQCFLLFESCHSLNDYQRLRMLANAVQSYSRLLHNSFTDIAGERLGAIDTLNIAIEEYLYRQRVAFAQFLVAHPETLFSNVLAVEPNIESHTRKLAALFHTDRAVGHKDQSLFQKLFVDIYAQKEILLSKLQIGRRKFDTIELFKKLGLEWWHKAIDISRARKNRWNEMQYLSADNLRSMTDNELAILQREYAHQSYEHYRVACHTLGNDGHTDEQIELRKFMALALHVADPDQFRLEAQLYAIAAIHLLVEFSPDFSIEKFNSLQKLIDKIQNPAASTIQPALDNTMTSNLSSGVLVLHPSTTRSLAIARQDIRTAIADDKRRLLLRQCLLRSANLRINTAEEGILEAKSQALRSQVTGIAAGIGGAAVTVGVTLKIYADIMTGFAAGSVLGPVGSIMGASIGLISGSVLGYLLFKKGDELIEEPLIREELNQILSDASKCYQENRVDDFFEAIAKPYAVYSKRLMRATLIDDHVEPKIDPEFIVRELLSHEFRPDGIAYLLILIGEGLLRGPTICAERHSNRIDSRTASVEAQKLFREVYANSALRERATFLDKKVTTIKLGDRAKYVKRMFQYFNRSVYSIPKEYFDDAITTPFTTRLSELIQIARLNYAISHLIEGDQGNLKRSHATIQRLKDDIQKTKHQHFFQIPELRINALEDLLAAFGFFDDRAKNPALETRTLLSIESLTSIEMITRVSIGANSVSSCERVLSIEDPAEGIPTLEHLLTLMPHTNQCQMSNAAPVQMLSLNELSRIADYYRTNFRLCRIESHPNHGHIFKPEGELIACRQSSNAPCIYLVVDDSKTNIIGMFIISEARVTHLLQKLSDTQNKTEQADLNIQIAEIFRERAERAEVQHHLLALPLWFDALKYYNDANQVASLPVAVLGQIRCMIMLGRYARADNSLRELLSTSFMTNGEAWYLRAVACRKQAQFDDAYFCARESLRCDYLDAQKEMKLCEKLKNDNLRNRIQAYERMTTRYTTAHRTGTNYNILSIDGGGCRGIIPAFWLAEIERMTKRSCSSLFDMMAGTSTGAIISLGLAVPSVTIPMCPKYKASDILQLYRTQSSSVFALPNSVLSRLGSSWGKSARYTDSGKRDVFIQYFGETRLADLLVDTVVPVVTGASNGTRLFTYRKYSGALPNNYQVKDVLMCTTAAPTYFEPYMLDSTLYVDGGVQANNPTMEALGQAIASGIEQKNIHVLSLGTGDYVPDPLHPNASRNLLFWASNSDTVVKAIFDGPQNNIDLNMNRLLSDDHYHRWEVWLEKPVALDDYHEPTLNMLCDLAREQLEAMDALDTRKRLGILIEQLRGID